MERIARNVAFSIVLIVCFSLLLFSIASSAEDNTKAMEVWVAAMPMAKQSSTTSLEDDFVLDFSQTQVDFIEPMDAGPGIFKFKGTNTGTKNLLVFFDWGCESEGAQVGKPVGTPQGETPLAPGESMWFKILPEGGHCGYDASAPQTITRTMSMSFSDHSDNSIGGIIVSL